MFFKATRPDGLDFRTGAVDYAAAAGGEPITPDLAADDDFPGPGWLHLAMVPTECVGMSWPCRLFEVEPVGDVYCDDEHPHKVGCRSVRVLREADAHLALGPQGRAVAAVIDRAGQLTGDEIDCLAAAWAAARGAAWAAARAAARDAAWDAAWSAARAAAWAAAWDAARAAARAAARGAARDAAWDAARAAAVLVVADLVGQHGLTAEHLYALLGPWRAVIGDPLAERAGVSS